MTSMINAHGAQGGDDENDRELGINQWRKDRAENEDRPNLTATGQRKSALALVCMQVYNKCNKETRTAMMK